jgi:capsular exopolysaccharide synthesis family protein
MTPADLASRGILQILWRRQLILLLSVVVCVVTAIIYVSQATPIYSSGSRINIDNQSNTIVGNMLIPTGSGADYLQTQCEVITSTPTVQDAVKLNNVMQLKSLANVDNPVGVIRGSLQAGVTRGTQIIQVSYESPYPEDCATIVNSVVEAYVKSQNAKRVKTAEQIRDILKEARDKEEDKRGQIQKKLTQYMDDHPNIGLGNDKGNVAVQKVSMLTDAIVKEQMTLVETKASYDAAKALLSDPEKIKRFIELRRESGVAGKMDDNIEDLAFQMKVLREGRGMMESAKPVVTLQMQMDELKQRMADAEKRYIDSYIAAVEQNYRASEAKIKELTENYKSAFNDATEVAKSTQAMRDLQADLARSERFIDTVETKIREINVNTREDGNVNIQVLEYAHPNGTPVRPKKLQVLGISVVLGLMIGFGAALLQDWMDQRLRSVDEISAALQLPILGVVPHIMGGKTAMARGMEVHVEPMSEVSEAYRTIRTAVYFGVPEGQDNTVLVTSPAPGDGKTTMASNLAIAMAQAGHSVLLVDCDFRRPRQHRIFGLKDDVGLSSVLAGDHKIEDAVQATAVPNLAMLPCGPIPSNPSEILNSQVFADTIDELKGKYDHVVIDSPPVNPVTDARILAASADVTIIVVRADKSTRKLAENAKESLLGVGANLLGVVVNDAPRSGRGYGGYGYGYYSDRLYRDRTAKSRSAASKNGPEKTASRN